MIELSQQLRDLIEARSSYVVSVVEIYTRDTVDISSISAPANAIARFSNTCFTWINSSGSYEYEAKIENFPSVKSFLDDRMNEAEIVISNTKRGEGSGSRFVLNNKIKGCWMVIRLIFPELSDENWIMWWGKCLRAGKIDNTTVALSATQEIGNYKVKIPFRKYSQSCPLTPGKGECLGNEKLEEKSLVYQKAYSEYGTMLCPDRTYQTCVKLGNEKFYQGQRNVVVNGEFSYYEEDKTKTKKKGRTLKTESWSSINQEGSDEVIPLGFGRFQLAGYPFTWADSGVEVKSLQGFCEGRINSFNFIKCRNTDITLISKIEHLGDFGNSGTQTPDILFNGFSGHNTKLAYLEVVTTSKPEEQDDAPLITAVIKGMEIPVPNINGEFNLIESSNNPVCVTRFLFTEEKYGRVPTYRLDDKYNLRTLDICNTLIEDRTQCESILLPKNEYYNYGVGYRRYYSTSLYNAYTDMYVNGRPGVDPDFQEPWIRWYEPYGQPPLLPSQNVLRKKYTFNGALQEETSLLDFLQKRVFPTFRGWLNYSREGKIQIRTREAADISHIRANTEPGETLLPINNVSAWRGNQSGYLIIGVGEEYSEVRKIINVLNSSACNNMPMEVTTTGTLSASVQTIQGGSNANQGIGYIDITGTVTPNSTIQVRFNSTPDEFYISYTTDGIEDLNCVTRMLTAHFNANPDFFNYLTAYILPGQPNRIYIRCEAGYLQLDKELEYDHFIAEEVMRVSMIFENCNDLYSDNSATLDNIMVDSFSWNDSNYDEVNAVSCLYTSAVDDFHVAKIIPRKSWDTIEEEAELIEEELDLRFVDNYWQAAYLTKAYAIEHIDGNLSFNWRTGLSGYMLEMGDVVAIRHDSGDGLLRYTPVWISSISYDLNELNTTIEGRLYLSSTWDYRVQPIEPLLTTSLNPEFVPFDPPPTGTSGGFGGASPELPKVYPLFSDLRETKYSAEGNDLI